MQSQRGFEITKKTIRQQIESNILGFPDAPLVVAEDVGEPPNIMEIKITITDGVVVGGYKGKMSPLNIQSAVYVFEKFKLQMLDSDEPLEAGDIDEGQEEMFARCRRKTLKLY